MNGKEKVIEKHLLDHVPDMAEGSRDDGGLSNGSGSWNTGSHFGCW